MATFDHERAHMAANLVSDPPVTDARLCIVIHDIYIVCNKDQNSNYVFLQILLISLNFYEL